ncbi:MAG: heme-copper oxidase subunit III [Candidatus Heimdallarchaeota archaeon]
MANTNETIVVHKTSLWPPFLAITAGSLGIALTFLSSGQFMIGIAILFSYLILLILFIVQETSVQKVKAEEERQYPRHFFMWIFLASEVLFFGLLIGISFIIRLRSTAWADLAQLLIELFGFHFQKGGIIPPVWPNATDVLNIPLTAVNTFILILSSVTMVKSVESIEKDDKEGLRNFLFFTAILGTIFLVIQLFEYYNLFASGFTPDSSLFGATFYLQTGFHGAHVFLGIIMVFFIAIKAHKGGYSRLNYSGVEAIGLYWHFVDLVWIMLFTIIYLI